MLIHSSTPNIVSTECCQQEGEDCSSIMSPTPIHRWLHSTNGYLLTQTNINEYITIAGWIDDRKFVFGDGDDGRGWNCQTQEDNYSDTIFQNHRVMVGNDCEKNDWITLEYK